MKKIVWTLVLVLVLCAFCTVNVMAASGCITDDANLLTETEEATLNAELSKLKSTYNVDVLVVTTFTTGDLSMEEYAVAHGAQGDAIVLLIAMEERDWSITGRGIGGGAVDINTIDDIGDVIVPDLSAGNYYDAFHSFAEECGYYLEVHIHGEPFPALKNFVICLIIGVVVALVVTGIMKGQLKSVRPKGSAADYVTPGSLNVTVAREFYLYRTMDRRPKPKSNSSGGGGGSRSSGSSHGGGKF